MSIIKRSGLYDMPAFFNDHFTRDLWNWGLTNNSTTNTTIPAVNIKETPEGFEVNVAAPGMKKDDFKVLLEGNMLTISSELSNERDEKDGDRYTRREFSYQSFQRSFQLPEVVDAEKIEARYENGLLHLSIPKKEEAKPRPPKMINIS
ncbi:MAG TPA: Hsp20/alpha crystallin family protein [Chitinophagaceae bacterium]|nr:Hsp20/alpha crystallin family protein [Chitinophagaceae bacterium]